MPEKNKHIPERQCMGCNERRPKAELLRLVRMPDGSVAADVTGKVNGRGAYVCKTEACLAKLKKSGRASRVLETAIPDAVWEKAARLIAESTEVSE